MPEPNEIDIIFYEVGLALDHILLLLYHIVKVDRTRERDTRGLGKSTICEIVIHEKNELCEIFIDSQPTEPVQPGLIGR